MLEYERFETVKPNRFLLIDLSSRNFELQGRSDESSLVLRVWLKTTLRYCPRRTHVTLMQHFSALLWRGRSLGGRPSMYDDLPAAHVRHTIGCGLTLHRKSPACDSAGRPSIEAEHKALRQANKISQPHLRSRLLVSRPGGVADWSCPRSTLRRGRRCAVPNLLSPHRQLQKRSL